MIFRILVFLLYISSLKFGVLYSNMAVIIIFGTYDKNLHTNNYTYGKP